MNKAIRLLFIGVCALTVNLANAQKELSNELIWASPMFYGESVDEVNSMNDGEHYTILEEDGSKIAINKYSFQTFEKTGQILNSGDVKLNGKEIEFSSYEFNSDESKILLSTDIKPIYRRSYTAFYYIYDIASKKTFELSEKEKGGQTLAELSPDGKKVAFVRNNNIYIKNLETGIEVAVTEDGKLNEIINGTTDWVYEEEFAITKGFYWSPNSDRIAYYKFDESKVKEFSMDYYGQLYPKEYKYKYPKAGEDNSKISLHLYDVPTKKTFDIYTGDESDIYIPRMKWTANNDMLCVLRMNRHQNKLEYCIADFTPKGASTLPYKLKPFYTETSSTYIEITDDLIFLQNDKGILRTSEKDGYNHIYLVDFNGTETQVTKGNWDVIALKGIDEVNNLVYYTSAETSPTQKEVYRIKTDGTGKTKLSVKAGSNEPVFSKGMKYFINYHTSANTVAYITLHNAEGKELKVLKDNNGINKNIKEYSANPKEFFTFKTSEGVELHAWMIKPKGFKNKTRYPVYLTFYGGPGHNEVLDEWDGPGYMWHQLLAQKGYLVVCVEPRGTMFRGEKFKKSTYLQLGKLETQDLIETAKYLGQLPYVNKNRIGAQGWSYGGYMTLLAMTKGAEYFKMGISIAPVTNWRYYDNIYTERFMRTPKENASGYDENSPINHVSKLKGKLLIVHGSADDNVHYQNTMEITNALIKANKQFDMFIYPNRNHGIYGGTTRLHLYTKMTNYVLDNL